MIILQKINALSHCNDDLVLTVFKCKYQKQRMYGTHFNVIV